MRANSFSNRNTDHPCKRPGVDPFHPDLFRDSGCEGGVKVLRIEYDDAPECPMDWGGQWTLYSFNRNSIHFKHPAAFFPLKIGLRRKFGVGLAFLLDYYEHGLGVYSLAGEGMQCLWDTAKCAGVLIWENKPSDMGAATKEDRAQDARAFLAAYNHWMNGQVYGYMLETDTGEDIDSCWGFYDTAAMSEHIAAQLQPGDQLKIEGQASGVLDTGKLPECVQVVAAAPGRMGARP